MKTKTIAFTTIGIILFSGGTYLLTKYFIEKHNEKIDNSVTSLNNALSIINNVK